MKMIKKLTTLCIALFILFTCAMPTMAQGEDEQPTEPTGSISIKAGKFASDSLSFDAYKLFTVTADGDKVAYKINSEFQEFFKNVDGNPLTDEEAYDKVNTEAKNKEFQTQLKNFIGNATLSKESLIYNAVLKEYKATNLKYGYYVVVPSDDKFTMSFTTLNELEQVVYLKGAVPGAEKTVNDKKFDSAQIGKEVEFKVESTIPVLTENDTTYCLKLTDKMSDGLTVDSNILKLSITIGESTNVDVSDYEITYTSEHEFSVLIRNLYKYKDHANEKIVFKYYAVLNENASSANPEKNTATIQHGNNPDTLPEGSTSTADVLTHQLTINKVDATDKTPLSGAIFELYKVVDQQQDGEKISFVDNKDGTYRVAIPGDLNIVDTVESNTTGTITIKGLSEGVYTLKEIKAPNGYNKLKDDVTITISVSYNDGEQKYVVDGNVVDVENNAGTLLPETGGMGTVVFTVVGVVGILAVAYSFMPKKSKNK